MCYRTNGKILIHNRFIDILFERTKNAIFNNINFNGLIAISHAYLEETD